jgi:hypothetical protein
MKSLTIAMLRMIFYSLDLNNKSKSYSEEKKSLNGYKKKMEYFLMI